MQDGQEPQQMQSVPINELLLHPELPFDVFIALSPAKYVMIAKAGNETEVLAKYKERGLDRCYLRLDDYMQMVQLSIREAQATTNAPNATDEAKMRGLLKAMNSVYNEIETLGFNEEAYAHAKMVNHATFMFLAKSPRSMEMLFKLQDHAKIGVAHSLFVSLLSAMIGVTHGWMKLGTIEKIALGGFLHDVGKTRMPADIINKPFDQMSTTDRIIYTSHPEVGAQLLMQVKDMPQDIVLIVQEHHELADGTGYPRGLKDLHISPLARVVSLGNALTEAIADSAGTPQQGKMPLILDDFKNSKAGKFNRDAMKAVDKLFSGALPGKAAG